MRIPRYIQLASDVGVVHKFWRAHNKSFIMREDEHKALYLKGIKRGLEHKSVGGEIKLSAYCVMSNHAHELVKYEGSVKKLSNFMRVAHSWFGLMYNKKNNRNGAVAYDRPKTPKIQSHSVHEMRTQFYIEANPLRAGILKNLKICKFSSFRFYAWGIRDEFTENLSVPEWYIQLGKTAKQRQSKYRRLFEKYLKEGNKRVSKYTESNYIGDKSWCIEKESILKILSKKLGPPKVVELT